MKSNSPWISLKILNKNGKVIQTIRSSKSRRIFYFIQRKEFSDCLFEVNVKYEKGYWNKSIPIPKDEILKTLKTFLEI